MLPTYEEIRSRLGPPLWWEAGGVPRYELFHPDMLGIYDNLAMCWLIACQYCGQEFQVGAGWNWTSYIVSREYDKDQLPPAAWLRRKLKNGPPHSGDPPRHDCVGDTMNCELIRAVEVWTKASFGDWRKRP